MTNRGTIAAIVLTLNEEDVLPRALKSLAWCDELVVLDSGSTDNTRQVALTHQARFVVNVPAKPFQITDQRNFALTDCGIASEWVIFLDADEEISPQLSIEIRSTLKHSVLDGYELTPRYWFLGRWLKRTQAYPNWHPRIVRSGYLSFDGGVWEQFSSYSRVGRISRPYEHYAFAKGTDDWVQRHCRYSTADAEEILSYLGANDASLLSQRNYVLRKIAVYLWFVRPFLRFTQKYIVNLGFLEGYQSLLFCLLMSFYDFMTVLKVIEIQRKRNDLPL